MMLTIVYMHHNCGENCPFVPSPWWGVGFVVLIGVTATLIHLTFR